MKYSDNMHKMAQDHDKMKTWHENMAKSAAESMQDHIKAAAWHDSQADLIKAMMNEVPLDPEEKKTTIPSGSYSPTPSGKTSSMPSTTEVPTDPKTVKKSDLTEILSSHVAEHGQFDMDIDTIVNFLINE